MANRYEHFRFNVPLDEGIYHIRLYAIPVTYDSMRASSMLLQGNTDLWTHFYQLSLNRPVAEQLPASMVLSMSPAHLAVDGELLLGVGKFDSFKLSLKPDERLMPIVGCIRDHNTEVWCEVTLEQAVLDAPVHLQNAGFLWPKKERSIFWGKLMRNESTGHVDTQSINEHGHSTSLTRRLIPHDGTLDLTFTHWLKVFGDRPAKFFADDCHALSSSYAFSGIAYGTKYVSWAQILQTLAMWMSPTFLVALSDHRLLTQDAAGDSFASVTKGNFIMPYSWESNWLGPTETVSELNKMLVCTETFGGFFSPLFFNDPTGSNAGSFYGFKSRSEALATICRELMLFPQVEIPTMEDLGQIGVLKNTTANRIANWNCTTKWLFLTYDDSALPIYVDADEQSIDYTPAATWASSYKVENPSSNDLLPAPAYSIVKGNTDGGTDQSYKLLTRIIGQAYVNNILENTGRGFELTLLDSHGNPEYVQKINYGGQAFTNWATFHATYRMNIWGSIRATLDVSSRGVGVEPFGDTATISGAALGRMKQTFNLLDWGEFPLLRKLNVRIGLLVEGETLVLEMLVYDIERQPDGGTKLKLIEVAEYVAPPPSSVSEAPVPPPPPHDSGPPVILIRTPTPGVTISGTQTVSVQATDDTKVTQVNLFVDGKIFGTLAQPVLSGYFDFAWDTTLEHNGTHTVMATAYDAVGNATTASITVTITGGLP
jgi:hypothetical protein